MAFLEVGCCLWQAVSSGGGARAECRLPEGGPMRRKVMPDVMDLSHVQVHDLSGVGRYV